MKPRFIHDCSACVSLGQFEEYDLYFCDQNGFEPTVIARWSSEGSHYLSGINFSCRPLLEAQVRMLELLVSA